MARFYEGGKSVLSFRGKFYTGTVFPWRERCARDDFSQGGNSVPDLSFRGESLTRARFSGGKVYAGGILCYNTGTHVPHWDLNPRRKDHQIFAPDALTTAPRIICRFTSHLIIFHLHGDVTSKGLQNLGPISPSRTICIILGQLSIGHTTFLKMSIFKEKLMLSRGLSSWNIRELYMSRGFFFYPGDKQTIFHPYGDVTIAGEGLQNLGLCLALRAFEQGEIFIVPYLL